MNEQTYQNYLNGTVPLTPADHRKFLAEATRRGRCYSLFIDGVVFKTNPEEGIRFISKSDEDAIESSYETAWMKSKMLDGFDWIEGPNYSTHAFRLYHNGRLVHEYTPPTPEEVAAGKVRKIFKYR